MRRIALNILLLVTLILTLTGCNKSTEDNSKKEDLNIQSYVLYENGEKLTFNELKEISKENSVAFKEKYCNVPATINAKITKITNDKIKVGNTICLEIWLDGKDGWSNYVAQIDYDKYKDLILEMKIGDYLRLTTNKVGCKFYTDFSRIEISNPIVEIVK